MIKVSVIVPVYNGEKYLEQCLDSICNQTLQEIEIICVDDGSTDSSWDILNRYKDQDDRIQLYRQQNLYAGVARNTGKSHATGEYLVFWDCDDFFEPDALEKMYGKAKAVDADVCVCGGNQFLESKQKLYPWPPYLSVKNIPETDTFNRFTNPDYYLNFTNAAAWNKIFKRSYIEQLKLDFQPVRNGNDVYFTVNAIGLADRITVLNEKLVNYRVNQSSGLVCSISKSPLSPIQAWMDIAENLEKHDGFGERSFANKAMGSMIYMLQNFQKWDAFRQAVEALKEYGLEKMHIQIQEDGYYYSVWNGECVRHLYQDTPEEFAVFFAYSVYVQKSEAYAEKRGMSQDLSLQKKAYKDLTKQNRANEKKIARDESKITRLEEKRDVLKEKNADLKRQLTEQKKKNEALGKKLKTVEQENQKIRASWSFRIGKVLMWLPGKIKRLFRKQ